MSDLYDLAAMVPHQLRGQLVPQRCRDLRERGVSPHAVNWRVDRGRMLHVSRDAYLLGSSPDLLDRLRAARLVLPPGAVIGFHSAAAMHGFGVLRSDPVHVVVPAATAVPQRRGVIAHESVVPVGEVAMVLGVPCTAPARTAVDLARTVRRADALPVLDAGLRAGAFTELELIAEVARHGGLRGIRQARELVSLADPRPECRQESQLRLLLHDRRVRGYEPQVTVRDQDGWPVCRIDLADAATRVGLEYDGMSHYDRDRARADRRRHNWLASRGWVLRYFTDQDLYWRTDQLVRTAADARRSRTNVHDRRSTRAG